MKHEQNYIDRLSDKYMYILPILFEPNMLLQRIV